MNDVTNRDTLDVSYTKANRNSVMTLIRLEDLNERIDVLLQPFFKEGTEILSFNKIDEIYSKGPDGLIYNTDKKIEYTEEELNDPNTDFYSIFDLMIDRWGCSEDVQYGEYFDSDEEVLDKTNYDIITDLECPSLILSKLSKLINRNLWINSFDTKHGCTVNYLQKCDGSIENIKTDYWDWNDNEIPYSFIGLKKYVDLTYKPDLILENTTKEVM
jgi:hypothetical protein